MPNSFIPYKWQLRTMTKFRKVFDHPNNQVMVVKARRQVQGKSLTAIACMLHCLCNSEFKAYGYYAPSLRQARHTFKELMKFYIQYNLHCTLDFNQSYLIITCKETNSSIEFGSLGTGDAVRGNTYAGIFVDECAFCDDDAISLLMPMLDVEKGFMMCISSPWHKEGFFYKVFTDESSIVEDWAEVPIEECCSQERLDFYRRTLKPTLFRTEILGEWLDSGESIIYGNITPCIISEQPEYNNEPLVIGVDTSSGANDYCCLTSFFLKDGIAYEHQTLRFCNSDVSARISQFTKFIGQYPPQYIKSIQWETNGGGSDLMQLVKKQLPPQYQSKFVSDYWNASTKSSAVSNSILWFSDNSIRLHSSLLIQECTRYTEFIDKQGRVTYGNAHQGDRTEHDDAWCSALHALSGLRKSSYKGSYNII